jgi:HK97 family phage major capsid protein
MSVAELAKKYEELEAKAKALKEENEKSKALIKDLESEKMKQFNSVVPGSHEQKLLRAFGVSNFKALVGVNTSEPNYAHVPVELKLEVCQLKKEIDTARIVSQMFYGSPKDRGEEDEKLGVCKNILETKYAKERDLAGRIKAFGTGVVGSGAEWLYTTISSAYLDEYLLEKQVMGLFQEINMTSPTYELPKKTNGTTARIVAEGAAATPSNFNTDKIIFNAKHKFVEYYELPEELNEDSAVDMISLGRAEVLESQLKAFEQSILNGDDSAPHMDADVVAVDDCRKAWKGLRKLALANSANGSLVTFSSAVTDPKLDEMIQAADKFGVSPREAVWIVSPRIYNQMKSLSTVTTVDKFGALATYLTGVLAARSGIAIVLSEFMRNNLHASGVYTDGLAPKSSILLVNKTRFMMGRRRPIRVRVAMDSNAAYDRWQMASYSRYDFKGHVQNATEKSVILGIDVSI